MSSKKTKKVKNINHKTLIVTFDAGKNIRGRERERGIKTKMHVKLAAKMLVIAWTFYA